MRLFILFVFIALTNFSVKSQECGSEELHQILMSQDPAYKNEIERAEIFYRNFISNQELARVDKCEQGRTYTIPVVVHVIHLGENVGIGSNISDNTIINAINIANNTFRNTNNRGLDFNIQFALAKRNPQGEATTGINRVDGRGVSLYQSQGIANSSDPGGANQLAIKGLSIWPRDRYYNIWVVHDIVGNIAGYANYPTTYSFEGTVMDYRYMTTQTFAHELGHAMNLRHTFEGDGTGSNCPQNGNCLIQGDGVCDTPPHKRAECGSSTTCTSNGAYDNVSLNIMSYCSSQRLKFTPGQRERVRAALFASTRFSLIESNSLTPVNPDLDLEIVSLSRTENVTCSEQETNLQVKNTGVAKIDSFKVSIRVNESQTFQFSIVKEINPGESADIVLQGLTLPVGKYDLLAELTKINTKTSDDISSNDFVCGSYEFGQDIAEKYCFDTESGTFSSNQVLSKDGGLDIGISNVTNCTNNGGYAIVYKQWGVNSGTDLADEIDLPPVFLGNEDGSVLIYDRAYAQENIITNTSVQISLSSDCKSSFQGLKLLSGNSLISTTDRFSNTGFVPRNCSDWKTDTIDLSAYNNKEALIRFQFRKITAINGQNIYLDNICLKNKYQINIIESEGGSASGAGIFIEGSNVLLKAQSAPGYRFLFWDENGIETQGNEILINVNGRRYLKPVFEKISTGVSNSIQGLSHRLYPNPAENSSILQLKSSSVKNVNIQLMDVSGRMIKSLGQWEINGESTIPFSTQELSSGMYLIQINHEGFVETLKLLVK